MSIFDLFSRDKSLNNFDLVLTEEQQSFMKQALSGKNVLVDACIGSGKTTAIQHLCDIMPRTKGILYLTYNRLLKIDAQKRIRNLNVTVTNYHGFASMLLKRSKISAGVQDLIQAVLNNEVLIPYYDVLIIDEYQDIEQELAELLERIKLFNPYIQIIAVGDMQQKIYDKTTLNVRDFITSFLGDYVELTFTKCFRLSSEYASMFGRIWGKTITGVNEKCDICEMNFDEVVDYLSDKEPEDILCLGSRDGSLPDLLNRLEELNPNKYNKKTVYASIKDYDNASGAKDLKDVAIFTTFDSSKGLERKICVIFDFTEAYWHIRSKMPLQNYEILRNVFCVSASRGKEKIIFVKSDDEILSEKTLSTKFDTRIRLKNISISEMFDFKYVEDVEKCYSCLDIRSVSSENDYLPINVKSNDYLIDLSPCLGIFQEAFYFKNYNIDKDINLHKKLHEKEKYLPYSFEDESVEKKVLYLTYLETKQRRYYSQVSDSYIDFETKKQLHDRLDTVFCEEETVQKECYIDFGDEKGHYAFSALGFADVVKDGAVYELKFVSGLMHKHYLQCACYMIALGVEKGFLWNTRTNEMFEVKITDKQLFMDLVAKTITKGVVNGYYKPKIELGKFFLNSLLKVTQTQRETLANFPEHIMKPVIEPKGMLDTNPELNYIKQATDYYEAQRLLLKEKIAVIDVETNSEQQLISVGVAVIDKETFSIIGEKYYVVDPEFKKEAIYSDALFCKDAGKYRKIDRNNLKIELQKLFEINNIKAIFAYNASYDYRFLDELKSYPWYDIQNIAAYKQHNKKIPADWRSYSTGRLKSGYGVEEMYRLLSDNFDFTESHNALLDAKCEANLVEMLGLPYDYYLKYARYK